MGLSINYYGILKLKCNNMRIIIIIHNDIVNVGFPSDSITVAEEESNEDICVMIQGLDTSDISPTLTIPLNITVQNPSSIGKCKHADLVLNSTIMICSCKPFDSRLPSNLHIFWTRYLHVFSINVLDPETDNVMASTDKNAMLVDGHTQTPNECHH